MTLAELKYIWADTLGNPPNDEILNHFVRYADSVETDASERIVYWLLMKSTALTFGNELSRAVWVADQIKAHHDGARLPLFSEQPVGPRSTAVSTAS